MIVKNILAIPSDYEACGNWRIIKPFERQPDDSPVRFHIYQPNTTISLQDYDGLLLQRPFGAMRLKMLARCKHLGKKVIVDIDDRFPGNDAGQEDQGYGRNSPLWSELRECMVQADGLIVSTPELKAHYLELSPRIEVCLNAIDLQSPIYRTRYERYPQLQGKTAMFWSGQIWGHLNNLQLIKSAVEQAMSQIPELCLMICGPRPLTDVFCLPPDQLLHVNPLPFDQFLRLASMADFSLAPLELNDFNDCKSEIRILESAAWAVPSIASPAAPYRRFYEKSNGACLLADRNEPQLWLDNIVRLANDPALRRDLGDAAKTALMREYNLQAQNQRRIAALMDQTLSESHPPSSASNSSA